MSKKVFLLLLLFSLSLGIALPLCGEIVSKDNLKFIYQPDQYYQETRKLIKNAKKSIYVIMFQIRPTELESCPVSILLQDLISAHKRGVEVAVILDESLKAGKQQVAVNTYPYNTLRQAGVKVCWDNPRVITHTKVIIVDDYISLLGSYDWTVSAFQYNNEASFLVKSREVARKFKEHFFQVQSQTSP